MPPLRKIAEKDVINAALELLKNQSMENLNARNIAKYLKCSVQPIFYNFKNMEELKEKVFSEIYKLYQKYMLEGAKEEKAYKGMGLAYIHFAKNYPNYFKILFMNKSNLTPQTFIENDNAGNKIIEQGMKFTGFTYEEQKKFHLKVWIFTHGLATLVATNTVNISNQEIDDLLATTVKEMLIGVKKG